MSLFNTKHERVCESTFVYKGPQYPKCFMLPLLVILLGIQNENQSELQFEGQILAGQRTRYVSSIS